MFPEHLLSALDLTRGQMESLFELTDRMPRKGAKLDILVGLTILPFFCEPSTRTLLSFVAAAQRLGADVAWVADAKASSVAKGESIEDTARIVEGLADLLIFRHPETGSVARAAAMVHIPVINAGDGTNEHPSQTLLDLYTIRERRGRIDGLRIAMVGDLRFGRTPHSLGLGLTRFDDVEVFLVAPPELAAPKDFVATLVDRGIRVHQTKVLRKVLPHIEALYVTRVQEERITDAKGKPDVERYERLKDCYCVDGPCLEALEPDAFIMHPLPRRDEIPRETDKDPRAIYIPQAWNGLPVREAILATMLNRTS